MRDMNDDGRITYRDVFLEAERIFLLPGDVSVRIFVDKFPAISSFLEISSESYSGYLAAILSIVFWTILYTCCRFAVHASSRIFGM